MPGHISDTIIFMKNFIKNNISLNYFFVYIASVAIVYASLLVNKWFILVVMLFGHFIWTILLGMNAWALWDEKRKRKITPSEFFFFLINLGLTIGLWAFVIKNT